VEAYKAVYDHADFQPGFRELCDQRNVEALDLGLDALRQVAKMTEELLQAASARTLTAQVVASEPDETMGRLYGAVSESGAVETIELFRDLDAALKWLGIEHFPVHLLEDPE